MNLIDIIRETLLMMGFTFIVGIAFAYVLKLLTLFLDRENLPSLLKRSRIWGRAYRMDVTLIYKNIRHITRTENGLIPLKAETLQSIMDDLAEYHFGNSEETAKQDTEMNNQLYEFHYGKI